jgi:hypothetical protein
LTAAQRKTHDCWTTTEKALTKDLPEDLQDAWERIRETASEFGEQRIYASHNSIMFSRKVCYFFVRPKKKYLEVVFFLGRQLKSPRSTSPIAQRRRSSGIRCGCAPDEVEAPMTDWLKEAYDFMRRPERLVVAAAVAAADELFNREPGSAVVLTLRP